MQLDLLQEAAVNAATTRRFLLVTGGAGTGKTTIIQAMAEHLEAAGERPRLCAFAGKAAARLTEATGREASTIHRMLQYDGVRFRREAFADRDSIIVDEASMIDTHLLAELTRRRPGRLVLVGDAAQLPPVGKGQPFHDLLHLQPDNAVTLRTCYRASEAVYHAASLIREGAQPPRRDVTANERWEVRQTGDAGHTHAAIVELVQQPEYDVDQDIILVPRNGENDQQPCTVKALNRAIVDLLNPREADERWRVGDRVICTKNHAAAQVWNGTTGTIHALDSDGCAWVRLDVPITTDNGTEQTVLFDKEMMRSLELAYALTVHKAQGSQYRRVVFAALARDSFSLLDRSLIYTAITRTQRECLVLGQYSALMGGINTVRPKRTVLQELAS